MSLLQRSDDMQIHQILPALDYGDAVSNDVIEIRNVLRKMGYSSEIFAKYIHPKVSKFAKNISRYKKDKDDIIMYHFPLAGFDITDFVISLPGTKILIYHNITPHNYFKNINDELYNLCWQGRDELKKLSKDVKLALGVSEYSKDELDTYGFTRTGVLPIFMDYSKYNERPNEKIIDKYNDDYINLLFVGRISPNKRQDDLIKIFYYYKRINPKSRLFLVGSYRNMEKYLNQLQELINRLKLEDVIFTGHIPFSEMVAYYRMSNVFICMSEHEGFCVPLLESMYFNIPIIAYDSTAIPYTLAKSGILVKKKSYDNISEMINLLVSDDTLRMKIVKGQTMRLKDFEVSNIEGQIKKYIDDVINSDKI